MVLLVTDRDKLFIDCCMFSWLTDDFDDFCLRASKLADESNGAPLFTVAQKHNLSKPVSHSELLVDSDGIQKDDSFGVEPINDAEGHAHDDEWQLL
jgi:cysteine protease ATG4